MNDAKEKNWENMPGSLLSWFLWTLKGIGEKGPKNWLMIGTIWIVAFATVSAAVFVGVQLYLIRANQINKTRLEIFDEQWKISSEPEWRAALLSTWSNPDKPKIISEDIWMQASMANHPIVKKVVATKKGAPIECKWILMQDERPDIRLPAYLSVIQNGDDLLRLCNDKDIGIIQTLALNQKTPQQILEKLSERDDNLEVLTAVASNPKTPETILEDLSKSKHEQVLFAVAANPGTPMQTLNRLAENINTAWNREKVSGRPPADSVKGALLSIILSRADLPDSLFRKFYDEEKSNIINPIAGNPKTPVDILAGLHHKHFAILQGKYDAEFTDEKEIREKKENAYLICIALAENPSTPPELLKNFHEEFDAVFKNYKANLIERLDYYLARNSSCPIEVLQQISESDNREIRANAAGNQSLPTDLLAKLSDDPADDVIMALVLNPSTHVELLKKIVNDSDGRKKRGEILEKIAKRRDLGLEMMNMLLDEDEERALIALASDSAITEEIFLRLSKSSSLEVLKAVAKNRFAPPTILRELHAKNHPEIMVNLAANESTPNQILQTFLHGNREIKRNLARNASTPMESLIILSSEEDPVIRLDAFASFIEKQAG